MSSATSKETCPFCERHLDCKEIVVIQVKVLKVSTVQVSKEVSKSARTHVHETCRANHRNKKTLLYPPQRMILLSQ